MLPENFIVCPKGDIASKAHCVWGRDKEIMLSGFDMDQKWTRKYLFYDGIQSFAIDV